MVQVLRRAILVTLMTSNSANEAELREMANLEKLGKSRGLSGQQSAKGQDSLSRYFSSVFAFRSNNSSQPRVRASEIVFDRRNSSGVLPQ